MPNTIYTELDPFFETISLLMISFHFDKVKQDMKNALSEMEVDSENFYTQHLKIFDRYVQTFQKYRVMDKEGEFFFDGDDPNFFLILLSLLNENRQFLASINDFKDNEINMEIADTCNKLFDIVRPAKRVENLDGIVMFLEDIPLSENAKWKIMRIMQNPKQQLEKLAGIVQDNIEAFKKAEGDVKKTLAKLLDRFKATINSKNAEPFLKMKDSLSQSSDIHPTLVYPLSQMMFEKHCYYGLVCDMVKNSGESGLQSKEALLTGLKALSDRSKLEILCSLKISPKYNLEIAGQLGLTAATMSHHMSVLLICGFVGVQKREGRVYYHLDQPAVTKFIQALEQTLL